MISAYCLLNHSLTKKQISELYSSYSVQTIVYPSKELSEQWAQISPEREKKTPIKNLVLWLKNANKGDIVIIQGEYGSTFTLVDFALKQNLIPLYATTKRIERETRKGEIISRHYIFEHVCFKKYEYYSSE